MKKPNPKKLILALPYHKWLDKADKAKLTRHANKIGGTVDHELSVHTASDSIAYAGPPGIEKALGNKCAYEVFMDYSMTCDEGELEGKGVEGDFYLDKGEIWVWAYDKMHTLDEWEKVVNDSYPKEDDSEEAYSIADFEGAVRNAINTALAAGISQSKVNEILQDIYNTEVEASDEED